MVRQAVIPVSALIANEDAAPRIQMAINKARYQPRFGGPIGLTVQLAPGEYRITKPLVIRDVTGLRLVGSGENTWLTWDGPEDQPVILLAGAERCEVSDLWIVPAKKADAGVWVTNSPGHISSANRFRSVRVGGYSAGHFRLGFAVWPGWHPETGEELGHQNNEMHRWENCYTGSYMDAGWHVRHGQAHQLRFRDCHADGMGEGKCGLHCEYGAYVDWWGGSFHANQKADFYLQDFFTGPCMLGGFTSEKSRCLVQCQATDQTTGASCQVTLRSGRWHGILPENGRFAVFHNPGPVAIEDVEIEAMLGGGELPKVYLTCFGQGSICLDGNRFKGLVSYGAERPLVLRGNNILARGTNSCWNHDTSEWERR